MALLDVAGGKVRVSPYMSFKRYMNGFLSRLMCLHNNVEFPILIDDQCGVLVDDIDDWLTMYVNHLCKQLWFQQ